MMRLVCGGPVSVRRGLSTILLAAAIGWACYPASAQTGADAQGWGLAQLMEAMRGVRHATGVFSEKKFMHMLKQPIQSVGTLTYRAPDRLEKRTTAPEQSDLTVIGDRLLITQPNGDKREISLSDIPQISALVESIRATLAGDIAALDRYYAPTITGSAAQWQLELQPRDPNLQKMVAAIRIQGEGTALRRVDTTDPDGDRTEMSISSGPG
jgi:outer membrane lipoprotein-sorting protein